MSCPAWGVADWRLLTKVLRRHVERIETTPRYDRSSRLYTGVCDSGPSSHHRHDPPAVCRAATLWLRRVTPQNSGPEPAVPRRQDESEWADEHLQSGQSLFHPRSARMSSYGRAVDHVRRAVTTAPLRQCLERGFEHAWLNPAR